ncbi:MAG TPA: hypothetical protein DGG94_11140 [Micromonosporaceae bacterium]|nr:hypothetical protein [Micromonosporaceae bacterium]HCU50335.1 hypothetical protein [Micromonosporaceae bacterium]
MDRAPARIHADIMDRLQQTIDDPDRQLTGVYLEEKDFISVWTAIRNGASMPASSWDTVILPVIACYSSDDALKGNLQLAIHLWGQARTALSTVDTPAIAAIVPVYEVIPEDTIDTLTLPPSPPMGAETPTAPPPMRRASRRRWWIAAAVTAAALLIPVAVVLTDKQPSGGLAESTARPTASLPFLPSPEASPSEDAATPTPAPSGSATTPPTAPRGLAVARKTQTTVTLTWQVPTYPGNGLSHYRIFRGMSDLGVVNGQTHTVTGLAPNTAYAFSVKAYDNMGLVSPASNSAPVTTRPRPASLKLAVKPDSPIPYGTQFTVGGAGWPCTSPAKVEIYLDGSLVARPATVDGGDFSAPMEVVVDVSSARVPIVDTSDYVLLKHGTMTINVVLPDQAQCTPMDPQTVSVTFT